MKKEELKNFENEQKAFSDAKVSHYNRCVEIMEKCLGELPEKSIDLEDTDDQPCMIYDGGNHPEYASNAFSMVRRIFLNSNGVVCAENEDCDEYTVDRWDFSDVTNLADYVTAFANEED